MNSREQILAKVAANQSATLSLPADVTFTPDGDVLETFKAVALAVGSKLFEVNQVSEIPGMITEQFPFAKRIVSPLPEMAVIAETDLAGINDPHTLKDVDLAILQPHFAVAENSAAWITEDRMGQRIVPFICQHLAIIVPVQDIVATMHQAYERIANADYGFGGFIAGPSKTADIEQSLVLGAHGPRSMTIFLVR
ncbi:lactate utilization protein B/C [Pedobacter sp. BS3]|uniref:LutC/YkgG family protein n=1 Tax=Pedobacter sp. BS3 TaxID=2567937 RepID=UPI0011EDB6DA|nr:LUD domain-containing protein [Pedobacter sp. BS3]TZF84085.1 lactate utilization protein B/C [Pedobacter sp. BS3]